METLRRPKIRDQAAQQIKQYILQHRLNPGDRLPTETQLASTFGISRLSVREATKSLEYLGIIDSKTGVGLTVAKIDMERVAEHFEFHPGLQQIEADQLIDSRIIVETGVLPWVARRMRTDASIQLRLQDLIDAFRKARQLKTKIDLDIAFHRTLLESSGLEPLVAFGDLLHVFFQRFRESVRKAEWKSSIESHQRIIDYLASGNVRQATSELHQHISSHKNLTTKS